MTTCPRQPPLSDPKNDCPDRFDCKNKQTKNNNNKKKIEKILEADAN